MSLTPNAYLGLWEGPIDNKASSVVNAIFDKEHGENMIIGDAVHLQPPKPDELLPRVDFIFDAGDILLFYGIAVGGDLGGIYPVAGGGFNPIPGETDFSTSVANESGEGVRICTQGRCIARVGATSSDVNIGDPLTSNADATLVLATSGQPVFARALQFKAQKTTSIRESYIAVDIQREGTLP